MSENLRTELYPPVFMLEMIGYDGGGATFACDKTVPKQSSAGNNGYRIYTADGGEGTTYESSSDSLDNANVAKYGAGTIIGANAGNSALGFPALGCRNDGKLQMTIDNFTTTAVTLDEGLTQMYLMLPLFHVEKDLY